MRSSREEIKNELNLYYVACTRAMCSLHIMCEKLEEFEPANILSAANYAELCDFSPFTPEFMEVQDFDGDKVAEQILISKPDEEMLSTLQKTFESKYSYKNSVNLPVKSSASELLKMGEEDNYYAENELFPTENEAFTADEEDKGSSQSSQQKADAGNISDAIANEFTAATQPAMSQKKQEKGKVNGFATGAERGTAYHRFLELCDFNIKNRAGIVQELENFEKSGLMPEEQTSLLNVDSLVDILSMTAFEKLDGCTLYREREFLCRLPANQFLPTDADDGVLIQGAIDLLAVGGQTTKIIDYKYSKKSDELLKQTYSAQLALYKKAVACILKIDEKNITTTIINIYKLSEINL
jgi:ATP-dependent helicase/nuclease subunit A